MIQIQSHFAVFGIARSGNHAIIDWLYDHLEPDKCFFNNIHQENPVKNRELYYINESKFFNTTNVKKYCLNKYLHQEDALRVYKKLLQKFTLERDWKLEKDLTLPEQCRNLLLSTENFSFSKRSLERMHKAEGAFSSEISRRTAVLIIRHPANLLASRIYLTEKQKANGPRVSNVDIESVLRLWKEYAELYLNKTQLEGYDQTSYITFEEWHTSPLLRKRFLEELNIQTPERRTNLVGLYGDGSSFDDNVQSLQDVTRLPLQSRWLQLLDNDAPEFIQAKKSFISTFRKHPEVLAAAETIWGSETGRSIREKFKSLL